MSNVVCLVPASRPSGRDGPIVLDPEMQRLYGEAGALAVGRLPVLIVGETGVGKEHLAEVIHERSGRAALPFVRINCAALTPSLFESELFGHERGAFTGGDREKPGLLETAGRGTVFLDEVGELPLSMQAKLLRALETGAAPRVGGLAARPIQARFVSATNKDLAAAIGAGELRRDLYYRLAGAVLVVPPLRARRSEIVPLAEAFAQRTARELGRPCPVLSAEARATLLAHPWGGNVRELRHVLERAVLLAQEGVVLAGHVAGALTRAAPETPGRPTWGAGATPACGAPAAEAARPADRRALVLQALAASGGNQKRAAGLLSVDRRTLSRWLDRLGIARPRKPAAST